ncbi:MAG: GNAT family N-acetyltransferase [Gammaproteobacteria bacterium]|nr:GNAT family N-acetyltransferase [Gammaproteobacteria bacterium]
MHRISSSYRAEDKLPDGRLLRFRAIRPGDRKKLQQAFHKLSTTSVRDRFFNVKLDLTPRELTYFTEVDFSMHVALVVELECGSEFRPVGVGRFVRNREQPDHSEFAITISDEMQGQGIGKLLLKQLIQCARELGVHHLDASVLPQNTRMTRLLHHTGLPVASHIEDGILTYSLTI